MRPGITKSRGGCLRCKRQKVRCDQVKPACGRCSRVGIECPGYNQQLKWSTKYEKPSHHADLRGQPSPAEVTATPSPSSPNFEDVAIQELFAVEMSDFSLSGFMPDLLLSPVGSPEDSTLPQSIRPAAPDLSEFTESRGSLGIAFQDLQVENVSINQLFLKSNNLEVATNPTGQLCQSLSDTATVLTEYYFKEAASLFSVYDSPMNPFRSTVSQLWKSSRLLHCTLQSMSAACLLENFPHLAKVGNSLRREAISILQSQHELDHTSLLALLMLGGSASWHDTSNLGLGFFNMARKRLETMISTNRLQKDSNNYHFFEEALIYWELLLAYVAEDGELQPAKAEASADRSIYLPSRHIPHPWTGVARDTQVTVQEVGRLIRRTRTIARSGQFATEQSILTLQRSIALARDMEAKLLTFVYPDEKDIVCPGDRITPVHHLLTLAEVYRRTGLAQLYRVFPDLLTERIRVENDQADRGNLDSTLSDSILHDERTNRNEWLTAYVLETLRMLEMIPVESGTRDFQPWLLVASCSELRFPPPISTVINLEGEPAVLSSEASASEQREPTLSEQSPSRSYSATCPIMINPPELSLRSIEVFRSRQFILDRLTSFVRVLPPKPMRICLNIAKESWIRLDAMQRLKSADTSQQQDVYWMDVMMDNKWETCMA